MSKKVFTSLPMRDRDMTDILDDMQEMVEITSEEFGKECEHIDSIFDELPTDEVINDGCWYLGKSIQAMSEADIVVFHPEWRTARGCIIEHMICALYNIPYIDISMDYGLDSEKNDVVDYTHDWDMAGEVNVELSKRVAEDEGLADILGDEDVEDALGFEHDDVDDLVESDPDLNPYAQHSEIKMSVMDEFDENGKLIKSDILEPGEYDADVR